MSEGQEISNPNSEWVSEPQIIHSASKIDSLHFAAAVHVIASLNERWQFSFVKLYCFINDTFLNTDYLRTNFEWYCLMHI